MMNPQDIANLFSALRDGEIRDLERVDHSEGSGDLQFKVHLPKLAELCGAGFQHFLCSLGGVQDFVLQPFRNDSTEMREVKQIGKLQLRIERAEVGEGEWVRVYCGHRGTITGARLSLKAQRLSVWDEKFDPLSVGELAMLRGRVVGK
jgi:hypothetical protein